MPYETHNTRGYRERESKFIVEGHSFKDILRAVCNVAGTHERVRYTGHDFYWATGKPNEFVRVRRSINKNNKNTGSYLIQEATYKQRDKESNSNRREVNVPIPQIDPTKVLFTNLFGEQVFSLKTRGFVIHVPGQEACFSIVKASRLGKKIFVEIEGGNQFLVRRYYERLSQRLRLVPEPRSFFEMMKEKTRG